MSPRRAHDSSGLLWTTFVLAHLLTVVAALWVYPFTGFGDVAVYHGWVREGLDGNGWPVLDHPSVYPVGALLPMILLAPVEGGGMYLMSWILLVSVLDAVVLVMIERDPRRSRTASWWWVLSILLLGPVALSRLESVMVPLTVVAVLWFPRRPAVASALVTLAGWIKVVPMVWLPLLLLAEPRRSRRMVAASAAVSAAMIIPSLALGSGGRIVSFLTAQTGRDLQIESVPATALQMGRLLGAGPEPRYDDELNTWQFGGATADLLGQVATWLLVPAVLGVLLVARRALRAMPDRRPDVLASTLLAATLCLIVFNKVGSPQYLAWPAAAVVLGLIVRDRASNRWLRWGAIVLAADLLTQLVFPHFYVPLLNGSPPVTVVLMVRNVLLVGLLVAVVRRLLVAEVSTVDVTVRVS